jgi:Type II secretion system (T2SS), protein N
MRPVSSMPALASRNRTKPGPASPKRSPTEGRTRARAGRRIGLIVTAAVIGLLAVLLAALPASLAAKFLPSDLAVGESSGTLWHGTAAGVLFRGRDLGAFEWRLHPASILRLRADAELRWVIQDFVIDGELLADKQNMTLEHVHGGGPVEDLRGLGVPESWRGSADINIESAIAQLNRDTGSATLSALRGRIQVKDLVAGVTGGANLGAYELTFGQAVGINGELTGQLHDLGGPLAVGGTVTFNPAEHRGVLSGQVRERGNVPTEISKQLAAAEQLRGRDAAGRIPFDLEFSL